MENQRGFTVVELVVVMTIMAILLVLTVVSLNNSRVDARDAKRKADVETIARGLEIRYREGNPKISAPSFVTKGSYPGVNETMHMQGYDRGAQGFVPAQITNGYLEEGLPGTQKSNYSPKGDVGGFGVACLGAVCAEGTDSSITSLSVNQYVYEPIDVNGIVCSNGDCVRFNLYYKSEKTGTVTVVKSKNQ